MWDSNCLVSISLKSNTGVFDKVIAAFSFKMSGFTALIVGSNKYFVINSINNLFKNNPNFFSKSSCLR